MEQRSRLSVMRRFPLFLRGPRWRPWIVVIAFGIAWKVVVLTLGVAVPKWVIGDGVAHLPQNVQSYAMTAQVTARALWDLPVERLGIVRALRVVKVDTARMLSQADSVVGAACGNLQAKVRAYTYFAIPYGEAHTLCDSGVLEYRVFRHDR